MPEGDSLVRLADRLRPVLEGRRLTRTDFRVPQLAVLDLTGRTVEEVRPRAKYLLMRAGDLTVVSHLKMEGSWEAYPLIGPAGGPQAPRWRHPGWQARCVLETAEHQVVGFQLGLLEVVPTSGVEDRLGFLGPDLLDPAWQDPAQAEGLLAEGVRRLRQDPERPIGLALLDQRLVSGIGNIYRCETLLLAGLDPHRPVSSVPDLPGLVLLARDLLRANVSPHPGGDLRTTTGVEPRAEAPYGVRVLVPTTTGGPAEAAGRRTPIRGLPTRRTPAYWVYGREHEGCLRCGGPVRREDYVDPRDPASGARQLWWCPRCQR
ncbi:endonuclease-8 [Raineyella antarctica]|uniref:DNA-(apurinic or apyrimidinic site) lyase n=1 Tax=Raineyella antarctica TaxID=1577474 RepID=A0A1G6GNX6_9ACTN|nr:DNA-formamidopyrimidine glycosylase family protein [Raineyella antarctica]SDB83712.1 endonuclease-8 [Raineyella antarctica]